MGTKKLLILVGVLALGGFLSFLMVDNGQKDVLRVMTWSNYFPEESLDQFTKLTGIKVELSYMSNNEELFAKLKAGATGIDVVQPSDYMIRQMVSMGMLEPLNHNHLKHIVHLDSYFSQLPYDRGFKHSVPFNWGTTGIAINTSKVSVGDNIGWDLLFNSPDPKHTALLDDMREVFAAAFRQQGKSINSTDPQVVESARAKIAQVSGEILMFTSEPKPLLLSGEINIAHIYSCDGLQAAIENPQIKFFIPKEGGVIWTDNLAIPKSSRRKEQAHQFIDFYLNPENAILVVKDKWLATPNKAVWQKLPADQTGNPQLYPPEQVKKNLTFLEDIGDTLLQLNRYWTELKS